MVKCPKCGEEILYIPLRDSTVMVDVEYTEVVTDQRRIVRGHLRHKCHKAEQPENNDTTDTGIQEGNSGQ